MASNKTFHFVYLGGYATQRPDYRVAPTRAARGFFADQYFGVSHRHCRLCADLPVCTQELTYDRYNTKADRIVRVVTTITTPEGSCNWPRVRCAWEIS